MFRAYPTATAQFFKSQFAAQSQDQFTNRGRSVTDYSSRDHLINELINHWRFWDRHEEYYLKTLAPQLVAMTWCCQTQVFESLFCSSMLKPPQHPSADPICMT